MDKYGILKILNQSLFSYNFGVTITELRQLSIQLWNNKERDFLTNGCKIFEPHF